MRFRTLLLITLLPASAGLCLTARGNSPTKPGDGPEADRPAVSDKQAPGCDDPDKMYGVMYRTTESDGTLAYHFVESCEAYLKAKAAASAGDTSQRPFAKRR